MSSRIKARTIPLLVLWGVVAWMLVGGVFIPSHAEKGDAMWELVWSDEFDYMGAPDPEKWRYDAGGGGWGNNELQYYTRGDNARVNDGCLEIELRAEELGGRQYTSSRMISVPGWKYGRFEISARVPSGKGTWPAIWMLPAVESPYGIWPGSGELDIMEHVGFEQDRIHQTIHTKAYNGMAGTQKGERRYVDDVSGSFHLYTLEWLPDGLRFAVDDEPLFVYNPSEFADPVTELEWPFDVPFSLILNIAYGGNWGGARGLDDDALPAVMEVDYVRVYQLA